ncbi:MAG TPA: MFS transporter [Candidatus Limnocylindria bacterium]|nr:MFS transporter [Candidatus Limnocylindria bacterium]
MFGPDGTRHRMVALTLALIAVAYLDRVCIATAAPAIKADLGLSDWQMGVVFSAFTFAYALFEVPSGWLADRFGARFTLTRIVLWWSAMTAATGLATGFGTLVALRFLFGMGEAGAFPATARAYARWLPVRERGRAFGLAIMTGAVAGALTQPLVVTLLGYITWHQAFAVFGSVGVAWAAAWWWWFRDDPREHPGVGRAELALMLQGGAEERPHEHIEWRLLASSRPLAALCLMYFFAIYGWYFYLTWLPTYLLRARGFDLTQAGWLAALPLLSIALGVLVGGWLSDHLAHRLGSRLGRSLCGVVGLPIAAAAVLAGIATADPVSSALLLALAGGAAALGVAPAWAVSLEIGGIHAGVVSGAMNMCGNLGGTLSPLVIGFALQRWGSWEAPLVSVAVFYLAAATCWLAIDPEDRLVVDR